MQTKPQSGMTAWQPGTLLGLLIIGYIGVYLCRRNLSVAIPLIQEHFDVSRTEIGFVASISTIVYAFGKLVGGPIVDRIGGRPGFLISLALVAAFTLLGAFAPSIGVLAILYSANRFAGSTSWGAMVKLVPEWFSYKKLAMALAILSLSYVAGGGIATLFGGMIVELGGGWRAVMGVPSLVLFALVVFCWFILPRQPIRQEQPALTELREEPFQYRKIFVLFTNRQFLVVCALSFSLTLLRETFGVWTVDFLYTQTGPDTSLGSAAFFSTLFDAFGVVSILLMGWIYHRVSPAQRGWLLAAILVCLGLLLCALPIMAGQGVWVLAISVGGIGLLVYGPYSLLAGVLAVEVKGKGYAATVAGLVDAAGYLAGVLSGFAFGYLIDQHGYSAGFQLMGLLMFLSAFLCLFLYPGGKPGGLLDDSGGALPLHPATQKPNQ
jgi:sugar phosphate permease